MKLNREALLARSLSRREVELPDVGTVTVRELSAAEVGQYVKLHKADDADELSMLAWIVCRAVCDDQGKPLFTDADLDAIKGMGLKTLKAIAEAVAGLSGLTDDDAAKKKPGVNSGTTPPAGSPSA